MNPTIIFGTKRLGKVAVVSTEKYPDLAVITVEGQKGAKKSRRVLFNSKAAELLNLEAGTIQNLVFASVETGEESGRQVLVADSSTMDQEDMITYKTSKNKVAYDDSSEKGKAITSSHVCTEIFGFLGKDDSRNIEFQLNTYPSDQLDAFSLDSVEPTPAIANENTADAPILEGNNGEYTGEELENSVKSEVAKAEEANPVLQRQTSNEVLTDEVATEEVADWQ